MNDPTSEEVRTLSKESQRKKQLQQLEGEIGAMNRSLEDLVHRIVQAKRERNALLPINQLPAELLVDIFSASIGTRLRRIYDLTAIASVAWGWNKIIKHTPILWAVLDSDFPIKLAHTAIQRAGDIPLTIRAGRALRSWSSGSEREPLRIRTPGEDDVTFLTIVFPRLPRWKHARLELVGGPRSLLQYLEQPAPLLESFCIQIPDGWQGSQVNLFQGHCPSLSEIDISGLAIQWSSRIFQNVRSISISDVWQHGPTVEEVLQLVGSSLRLKHFYISGLPPSNQPPGIPPVEVPHLDSLSILYMDASSTQHILSRIRTPTLTKLVVKPTLHQSDSYHLPTFLDVALRHFNPTIRSGIERAHSLYISIDWHGGIISISTRHASGPGAPTNEDIILDFSNKSNTKGLQLCLGLLLPSPTLCPPVSLGITATKNIPESDLHWMESEINNRVTEISFAPPDNGGFLSLLCTGRNRGGTVKWPFPRVRKLALPRRISGEEAVRLIRQRYAPAAKDFTRSQPASSGGFVYEPVDRLSQLQVEGVGFNEVEYDRLAKIVGKDILVEDSDSDSSD